MTYSRPSIRPVSIGAARQRQQTRIVDNNRGVRQAPNARFIDASSVEIAGKNAARTDAEIKAFIDGLSPIVETVGKSIIQQKANDQLGELIRQDPEIGKKYLQGDPDTQARINSLNGYTKELFIASQKQSALSSYKELLPSLLLADERITGANALKDPEAYAAAESEIKQKAMQMSGLAGLPTDVLGAMSPQVGQINGAVRGKAYAAQNTDQQRINLTTIGDGQVSNTVELAEGLESLKGAARKKARPRMIAIEKELDSLEAKHKKKQIVAPPASAPDGFVALQVLTAKKSLPVLVCADEPYVRHQCTLSHERSGGKSLPMLFDASANGKARKAGLGRRGRIVDVDKKDASAKVQFSDLGSSAWYPVAALSAVQ